MAYGDYLDQQKLLERAKSEVLYHHPDSAMNGDEWYTNTAKELAREIAPDAVNEIIEKHVLGVIKDKVTWSNNKAKQLLDDLVETGQEMIPELIELSPYLLRVPVRVAGKEKPIFKNVRFGYMTLDDYMARASYERDMAAKEHNKRIARAEKLEAIALTLRNAGVSRIDDIKQPATV